MTDETRRVALLSGSFQGLARLLQQDGTYALKIEGFPEGAKLAFVDVDNQQGMLRLYVEHESLPETWEGCLVLELSALIETRYEGQFAPKEAE